MQFIVLEKTDFVEGEVAGSGKKLKNFNGPGVISQKNACLRGAPLLLLGKSCLVDIDSLGKISGIPAAAWWRKLWVSG
jgi:hypothetical protein